MSGAIITYEESGTDTGSRHRHNGYSSGFSPALDQGADHGWETGPASAIHGRRDRAGPDGRRSTHLLAADLAVLPVRPGTSASDAETTYVNRDRRATFYTLVAAHL
jgi:hypothetical protein